MRQNFGVRDTMPPAEAETGKGEFAGRGTFRPPFFHDQKYAAFLERKAYLARLRLERSFFVPHQGVNNAMSVVGGRELINFSSYNYLALAGHPEVSAAAIEAVERYGTSVSASRIVSGEIPLHRALETSIARFIGAEDAIVYVGGHATNVTTIGHLFGAKDLILYDALVHNSILEGCRLSGARCLMFRHNDPAHLETLLARHRAAFERVLVVVEGVYSMDGDIADLPALVALKQRYGAALMVDEAHSLGVLGATGRGIAEHFAIDPGDVDLWMGTLSKTLASCGGYIAGAADLIEYLKFTSPGFIFSVGLPPAAAGAALAALQVIEREPERVRTLAARSALFLAAARDEGLDTGRAVGTAIVPIITGDSMHAVGLSQALHAAGISAHPIIYPAVKNRAARVRFFIAADHSEQQVRHVVLTVAREWRQLIQPARARARDEAFAEVA
jgi:8-amino-7-oxononanoate synthase